MAIYTHYMSNDLTVIEKGEDWCREFVIEVDPDNYWPLDIVDEDSGEQMELSDFTKHEQHELLMACRAIYD